MHILLVNDDGPPCPRTSPFVVSLCQALQSAGHSISVILPSQQRSWIGKAHFIDATVTPTLFYPSGSGSDKTRWEDTWTLVNATPATCVQLGIYHCFNDRGPIDLVVSGPNLGRNSTTVFSLSSGTIGAAMEAALCGKRAIALSFAQKPGSSDSAAIDEACNHSVRLIEHLYNLWPEDVDLYSINVPLEVSVGAQKIMRTSISKRRWPSTGAFHATDEKRRGIDGSGQHVQFQWAPRTDFLHNVEESSTENDDWVINRGMTSVTALQANFMHSYRDKGEIILPGSR